MTRRSIHIVVGNQQVMDAFQKRIVDDSDRVGWILAEQARFNGSIVTMTKDSQREILIDAIVAIPDQIKRNVVCREPLGESGVTRLVLLVFKLLVPPPVQQWRESPNAPAERA